MRLIGDDVRRLGRYGKEEEGLERSGLESGVEFGEQMRE